MIVKLHRRQPELKIMLVDPGREGPESPRGIRLIITAPSPPKEGSVSKIIRKGSWGYPPVEPPEVDVYPPEPDALPALVYPAMHVDEDGAVVFHLDRRLWDRPCGRYVGRVEIGDRVFAEMDIDLNPISWVLEYAEVCP